ncbi:MAG: signal peptidase I [Calditrichaeota bacterium]|nr:signal peptidase I [Calditrichota bacterium]
MSEKKFDLRLFILETLPISFARKIQAGYERPVKGNIFASLIRLLTFIILAQYFIIRPYLVPTGSMNHTIENNDFLLVNRFIYGVKTPDNISIPFTNIVFVREIPTIKITPQLRSIKSNDILVFRADHEEPIVEYVKRLVGAPGDRVRMDAGQIFVNDSPFQNAPDAKLADQIADKDVNELQRDLNIQSIVLGGGYSDGIINAYDFPKGRSPESIIEDIIRVSMEYTLTIKMDLMDPKNYQSLKQAAERAIYVHSLQQPFQVSSQSYEELLFDATKSYFSSRGFADILNRDNFGTIHVPREGDILILDSVHSDIISNVVFYDGHQLNFKNGAYFIDGIESKTYTVEQDYYFFIGDNRHNSLDSRSWGFVPHKFINAAPILIYMNLKEGFWDGNRAFMSLMRIPKNIGWDRIGKILF